MPTSGEFPASVDNTPNLTYLMKATDVVQEGRGGGSTSR